MTWYRAAGTARQHRGARTGRYDYCIRVVHTSGATELNNVNAKNLVNHYDVSLELLSAASCSRFPLSYPSLFFHKIHKLPAAYAQPVKK